MAGLGRDRVENQKRRGAKLLVDFAGHTPTVLPFSHEIEGARQADRGHFFPDQDVVMKQIKLNVQAREGKGRGAARRLRASGKVPAVVYGKYNAPVAIVIEKPEVTRLLKETAGAASLVELTQDGKATLSIVQEVQRNPMTEQIIHIDFHEVSAKEEMHTHVKIHLIGEAFGVKNQNGLLDFVSHQVDIRCLPKDLPEFIEVDISNLKVGESLHVKELPQLSGVTYDADPDHVIASCTEQKVDTAATTEAAPAPAAAAAATETKKPE
jgi:large subunit ribosomal protein L25